LTVILTRKPFTKFNGKLLSFLLTSKPVDVAQPSKCGDLISLFEAQYLGDWDICGTQLSKCGDLISLSACFLHRI
ncbi:unnamed protein product, partial [Brassica rapa]